MLSSNSFFSLKFITENSKWSEFKAKVLVLTDVMFKYIDTNRTKSEMMKKFRNVKEQNTIDLRLPGVPSGGRERHFGLPSDLCQFSPASDTLTMPADCRTEAVTFAAERALFGSCRAIAGARGSPSVSAGVA